MRGQTAKRARLAKVLDHRVERLATTRVANVKKERKLSVRLPDPPRPGAVVLDVAGMAKAFGRNTVFDDVSFTVGRGERLAHPRAQRRGQDDAAAPARRAARGRRG